MPSLLTLTFQIQDWGCLSLGVLSDPWHREVSVLMDQNHRETLPSHGRWSGAHDRVCCWLKLQYVSFANLPHILEEMAFNWRQPLSFRESWLLAHLGRDSTGKTSREVHKHVRVKHNYIYYYCCHSIFCSLSIWGWQYCFPDGQSCSLISAIHLSLHDVQCKLNQSWSWVWARSYNGDCVWQ